MLKRIVEIRNVGTFYDVRPEGGIEFRKLTLIYGANGTGKTTLAAILRSLARNEAAILQGRKTLGREGGSRVELEFAGGRRCVRDGEKREGEPPPIEIYDEQFVRDNLFSDHVTTDHRRNLLHIVQGEEPARLAREIRELDETSRELQKEITSQRKSLEAIIGAVMASHEFVAIEPVPAIDSKIENKKEEIARHENSEKIVGQEALGCLPIPELSGALRNLLEQSFEGVADDAERTLEAHLARFGRDPAHEPWLERGLRLVRDEACPFCGQSLQEARALIAACRTVFGERYRNLKREIEEARAKVRKTLGERADDEVRNTLSKNQALVFFWQRYVSAEWTELKLDDRWLAVWRKYREAALAALERKATAPLEKVTAPELDETRREFEKTLSASRAYNDAVETIYSLIQVCKDNASLDELATAQRELARLQLVRRRYEPKIAETCEKYKERRSRKTDIDVKKEHLRTQLKSVEARIMEPYAERVNEIREEFEADFKVAEIAHGDGRAGPDLNWSIEVRQKRCRLGMKRRLRASHN